MNEYLVLESSSEKKCLGVVKNEQGIFDGDVCFPS